MILTFQVGGPGSSPGGRIFIIFRMNNNDLNQKESLLIEKLKSHFLELG
jgi:hypothetical protein